MRIPEKCRVWEEKLYSPAHFENEEAILDSPSPF
jgi:hypothetical protein